MCVNTLFVFSVHRIVYRCTAPGGAQFSKKGDTGTVDIVSEEFKLTDDSKAFYCGSDCRAETEG